MSARRASQSKRVDDERMKDTVPQDAEDVTAEDGELEVRDSVTDEPDIDAEVQDESEGEGDADDDPQTLKDRWLRAEADLQNFRRRAAREREESRVAAEESVILDVIAVMDDLDRAMDAARASDVEGAWLEGFELVATHLRDALSRRGVEQLDPIGTPFDPEYHEALLEIDAPEGAAPGDVVQVVLKGYRRNGRALRAARVVVARSPGKEA